MTVDGYTLEPARTGDLAALADIERACAGDFPLSVLPQERRDDVVPLEILEAAQRDGRLWVVLEAAGVPVGFLLAQIMDRAVYVAELAVHPLHQKRGLGRALMTQAVQWARRERYAEVALTTFASVPWNAPWYRKLGFAEINPDELPPQLRDCLAHERNAGLADRVAMRLRVV